MPPAIELRHLRYFLAVMEELHFGRAARRLHIAQPPLSQAIMRLESELGVKLLHRTSRVVMPTTAGHVFAHEARILLAEFEGAIAETRRAGGATLSLRIGCVSGLTFARTEQFLAMLRRRLPESRPEVTHMLTREQVARLLAGDLELAIFDRAGEFPDLETEPLFMGPAMTALVPVGHPLATAPAAGPDDLRGADLVMFPRAANAALHDGMLALLAHAGYAVDSVRELGGTDLRDALVAVAQGRGVAIGPFAPESVREAGALVAHVPLDPPVYMPETVIAWRADPRPRLRALVEELRRGARELRRQA